MGFRSPKALIQYSERSEVTTSDRGLLNHMDTDKTQSFRAHVQTLPSRLDYSTFKLLDNMQDTK